jgi:hypothetical protein
MDREERRSFIKQAGESYLQADIALLNEHNVSDDVMALMAAEHAARVETLARAVDPTLGRALILMIANLFLQNVKDMDAATVQEPEIVHV